MLVSADGLILRANQAAAELIEHDRDRMIGRLIQDLLFKSAFGGSLVDEMKISRPRGPAGLCSRRWSEHSRLVRPWLPASRGVLWHSADVTSMKHLVRRAQRVASRPGPSSVAIAAAGDRRSAGRDEQRRYAERAQQGVAVRDRRNSPVLLFGETGTGKGVFAKLIHEASPRSSQRFLTAARFQKVCWRPS